MLKNLKNNLLRTAVVAFVLVSMAGCRGFRSEQPAVHLNPNMDWQPKFKSQTHTQLPPAGTVAWGSGAIYTQNKKTADFLEADPVYYRGRTPKGAFIKKIPVPVTNALISRGQERFNIYCAACHDRAGTGNSPVVLRGMVRPPLLSDPRVIAFEDGQIFDVITNGARNMQPHKDLVPVADRWAIVAYVRALQLSQSATLADLSLKQKQALKMKESR